MTTSQGMKYQKRRVAGRQVSRYIRLTELEPSLLQLVDEGRIAMTPAVELSYLPAERQKEIYETILSEEATPSLSQAKRMRAMNDAGELSMDSIFAVLTEEKGNQVETIKLPVRELRKYFKPGVSYPEMQRVIMKLLDDWYRKKQRNRDDYSR